MLVPSPRSPSGWNRSSLVGVALAASVLVAVAIVLGQRTTGDQSAEQVAGSSAAAADLRRLPAFSAVTIAVGAEVRIRPAAQPVAVIRTDDNLVGRITTRVHDGALVVGSAGRFTTKTPLTVAIGVPGLRALTLSGGGTVRLQHVSGTRFTVTLSGLGGSVRASGKVGRLDVALRTFGNADLKAVTAQHVHAVLSGSGQIGVTATRRLDATLSGSGAIRYYGHPTQVHKTVLGSGSVAPG